MKKRILSLLMATVMLISAIPAMGASAKKGQVFRDIAQDAWYAPFVYPLSDADIVSGMDSVPNYKANNSLKRSEFLSLLANSVTHDFSAYEDLGLCPDADNSGKVQWYSGFINWAAQEGIIPSGQNFRPKDDILRSEAVEMTYALHKAHPEVAPLTPVQDATDFVDKADIPESLNEALTACNLANVINGDTSGRFNPNKTLNRGEAAVIMCRMLEIKEWDISQIPAPPKFEAPKTGSGYGASYVEFDPQFFTAKIALANGKLDSSAPYSSILSGQNAYIAVDGAVFNTGSLSTYGSFISNGKVLRILRPNPGATPEPCFVTDSSGKASIQWINIEQTVTRTGQDGTPMSIKNVGVNTSVGSADGSRMIYTREYASTVSGNVAYALAVDNSGTITNVYQSKSNVPVPASGYLLFTRMKRDEWTDRYFTQAKVGDKMERTFNYNGSTTQDVKTLISCGPTVLKKGSVYKNYAAEGFDSSSNVLGGGSHMLIGVKPNGRVVIANASGSQDSMGNIMKNLGCTSAINLDGGASTYLYCKSPAKTINGLGRNLTNMLVFSQK